METKNKKVSRVKKLPGAIVFSAGCSFCCSKQFLSTSEVIAGLKTLTQKCEVIGGNFRKFLELKDFYTI